MNALRSRQLLPADFDAFFQLSYLQRGCCESMREKIREEFECLIQHANPLSTVLESLGQDNLGRVYAIAIGVFLSDAFTQWLLAAEEPNVNVHMLNWQKAGKSPFLTRTQIAAAHQSGKLHLLAHTFTWDETVSEEDQALLRTQVLNRYADRGAAFRIEQMLVEVHTPYLLAGTLEAGFHVVNRYGKTEEDAVPVLLSMNREQGLKTQNYFMLRWFTGRRPTLDLSLPQVEVLSKAQQGLTDLEIADQLNTSAAAIKKRWQAIYSKIDARVPGLLPQSDGTSRGSEKRRICLSYLDDHPEEVWGI